MKSLILIFIFILSSTNCQNRIQKVQMDTEHAQRLNTTATKSGYFYLELDHASDYIYLYFADSKYHLIPSNLEVCYTHEQPVQIKDAILNCNFRNIYYYETRITKKTSLIEYLYRYDYSYIERKKYIIVHYSGVDPRGILKVKASYKEINWDEKKEEKMPEYVFEYDTSSAYDAAQTAVQVWVIVVIIISVVSVVGTVIVIVVVVCVCRRRTVYGGAPVCVAQPGAVVYSPQAAAAYPLV